MWKIGKSWQGQIRPITIPFGNFKLPVNFLHVKKAYLGVFRKIIWVKWQNPRNEINPSTKLRVDLRIAKKTFDNLFNLHSQILFLNFWNTFEYWNFCRTQLRSESTTLKVPNLKMKVRYSNFCGWNKCLKVFIKELTFNNGGLPKSFLMF